MIKINAITQAHLIKLLLEGTYSCTELARETGLHYVTVLRYARELHRAKAVHISMWEKDEYGRDMVKIYKLGEGKDAPRRVMSAAERQKRHRSKDKQIAMNHMMAGNKEVT